MPSDLQVTLSFPAISGIELDSIGAIHRGYEAEQKRAANRGWEPFIRSQRSNRMYYDVDDYGGLTVLPPYFLFKAMSPDALEALSRELELDQMACRPRATGARFYYSDSGVIVGNLALSIDGLATDTAADIAVEVGALSSRIPQVLNEHMAVLGAELEDNIGEDMRTTPKPDEIDRHHVLWVHQVYVGHLGPEVDWEGAQQIADALSGRRVRREGGNSALRPGEIVDAGLSRSVALRPAGPVETEDVSHILPRVLNLQNAVWTGAFSMDRGLFLYQNSALHELRDTGRYDYTRELHLDVNRYRSRGRLFRSTLFDNVIHQSPQTRAVWAQISKAWKTEELIEAFENKLDRLDEINGDMSQYLIEGREYKLNLIVLALTLIGVATVFMDVFDFSQGGVEQVNGLRLGVVMVAVLITMVVGFESFKRLRH